MIGIPFLYKFYNEKDYVLGCNAFSANILFAKTLILLNVNPFSGKNIHHILCCIYMVKIPFSE